MIRAIGIDDEPMSLNILSRYSAKIDNVNLLGTFTSTLEAQNYLAQHSVDLLFLDINMPAISGLDFFRSLQEPYMLIFTTAYSEYAVEGFNLNAIDYLLKPFGFERFQQAVNKAVDFHRYQHGENKYEFSIKSGADIIRIATEDILFIEAFTDYLKIHRRNQKKIILRMTMINILALLPKGFIRVHRSFIVPIHKVEQLIDRKLWIEGNQIPIGKTYYKKIQALLVP